MMLGSSDQFGGCQKAFATGRRGCSLKIVWACEIFDRFLDVALIRSMSNILLERFCPAR